jgi:chromate transporter
LGWKYLQKRDPRAKSAQIGLASAPARSKSGGMPPDSPPAAIAAPELPTSSPPGLIELFVAFAKMSLAGFGGVLVFARRGIVEQHRWMTAEEFNETFALCHFLPGPNIVNLSVVFGSRFRGVAGSIAAFAGLLGPPLVIMILLAALYARFGEIVALRRILAGVSCAAVGLLMSVVFRMLMPLLRKRDAAGMAVLLAVFVAIGLLRLPLPAVLGVAIPLSIAITFALRRKSGA